ncbi:mechanosensitive ion channel domain-containing protein [Synoicihabitans lomoniglobus]|uniref:Mechanosensitive ion channel n=1 Tax=Synoicihabitans lomoniglobus TaxID=2909285 RepID=A0AAE9ZUN7_9BACT|nr:mechanosensitive ion channel [Opitutaceae bacterium LMO-M01]WED64606.1 mechanosensitive ion channel [Opitutaceae bacterium LMO-M01]
MVSPARFFNLTHAPRYALPALLGMALATSVITRAQEPTLPAFPGAISSAESGHGETTKEESNKLDPAEIAAARDEVAATLAERRAALDEAGKDSSEADTVWQTQEIELWERLDRVYADQARSADHRVELEAEAAELAERQARRSETSTSINEIPTFAVLEKLYDQRDYFNHAARWLERDIENATDDLNAAEEALDERERERRATREKKEEDPANHLDDFLLAELRSRLAKETLRLRQHALDTLRLQESLIEPNLDLILPQVAWVKARLVHAEAEQRLRDEARAEHLENLREQLEDARDEVSRFSSDLAQAETRENVAKTLLDPRRDGQRVANSLLSLIGRQILRVEQAALVEQRRLDALHHTVDQDTKDDWAEQNETALRRLQNQRREHLSDLVRTRRQLQALRQQVDQDNAPDRATRDALERQLEITQQWIEVADREVSEINAMRNARRRLQEELDAGFSTFSVGEAWHETLRALKLAWEYELFTVDDQPVRVRSLLAVILLIVAGVLVARRISRMIGRLARSRLKWSRGRAAAWQTLFFYAFICFILLNIFSLFHLSLTQFSVISGALAVGLGFGSQNLINNFISGIILLVERPIAEGDLIEIDGAQLWVERIGMRSTVVRSFDNTHIVVPNSRLLEQPVTNWTLSDDVVRQKISVGVAYDSDTRKVDEILNSVLEKLDVVLAEPATLVLFDSFGDNSLNFLAIFHTRIEDRFEALTEVRHCIVDAFRSNGISIAFPQRDVHLDTSKPLQINLQSEAPEVPAKATSPAPEDEPELTRKSEPEPSR